MEQKFGNIVNEYYVRRFRETARKRRKRLSAVKTRAQALEYISDVRRKIRDCFALDCEERTPLNPKTTAVHKMPGYTLECVLFESRPGFYVTANLYLPESRSGKVPCVLLLCGHNLDAKCCANYSIFTANLASNGFAVLTADPICQGERYQFQAENGGLENVYGHNMLGKKMLAYGDFFGAWRAFDAVRSVDYLLQRDEIDPERLYALGCSGGGTLTAWVTALEDRIAGAIPSCYITSWLHNVENELPVDAEQTPPGLSGAGLEMADFLIAAAPRYLHISGEKNDFFDARGGHETFEEVRRFYCLLGKEDKISCFFGPESHGWRPGQRNAAARILMQWAGLRTPYIPETETVQAPAEKKYAAPGGSVFQIPGSRSALELLQERADKVIASQKVLTKTELAEKIAELLKMPQRVPLPSYRILRPKEFPGKNLSRFLQEDTETPLGVLHIHSEAVYFHIPEGESCLLYIPHWDSEKEVPEFCKDEKPYGRCFSFDPFGIGEMTPASCDFTDREFGAFYNYDYHFAACGLMLGEPYMSVRIRGILGAIRLLRAAGYSKITLAGSGQSSVPAAFASLLAGRMLSKTVLINPLKSYRSFLDKATLWPQSGVLPDILKYTDLPQIYEAVHAELTGGWFRKNFR